MRQESYKILAEHFADKAGLAVHFEANATPSTDGSSITLPTEVNEQCVNPLIGALLHETAHVKHTANPYEVFKNTSEFMQCCINTLEDIRVDYLTSQKYPNSYDFIRELTSHVIGKQKDALQAEPEPVRVLKGLLLTAIGFNPADLYEEPTVKSIKRCAKYIDQAKECRDTWQTVNVARRLLIDLIGKDAARRDQLQKQAQKAAEAYDKMRQLNEEYKDMNKDQDAKRETLRKLSREFEKENRSAHRLEREAATDEAKEKAKQKRNVANRVAEEYNKKAEELNQEGKKLADKRGDFYTEQQALTDADREINKEMNEEMDGEDYGEGCSLSGFSALENVDLKPDKHARLETKTIDEVIAEALLQRKDEAIIDEQGNRLNSGALADFETEPEKLFTVTEKQLEKTKVAFLIDVSGSMGDFNSDSSLSMAFDTLDVLLRAVHGAIEQGAPCDVSLYAFATDTRRVLENLDNYDTAKAKKLINKGRQDLGGGTSLLDAVNIASADLTNEAQHRTMIVITDAEVNDHDCQEIINKTSGDCKQIFIAVGDRYLNGATKQLFGNNVINDRDSAMEIIGKALYQSI